MELMYETRLEVTARRGKIHAVQNTPRLHPEPVVVGDTPADAGGASIYGTVLKDGGRLRMWYTPKPANYIGGDIFNIAYAESDDGIHWHKPPMNQVTSEGQATNLVNLQLHCPSVFIDPDAEPNQRYRASGWRRGKDSFKGPDSGYYLASSPDGLHWELDETSQLDGSDVITSVYHPHWRCAWAAHKHMIHYRDMRRRAIWMAFVKNGEWSEPASALIPDDFDDVCAVARGAHMGDYYGMGMQPAGRGMVGFLWNHRFRTAQFQKRGKAAAGLGTYGHLDVTLAYRTGLYDRWLQPGGRQDFIRHQDVPWGAGRVATSSTPVEVEDEHRLYFGGGRTTHDWQHGFTDEADLEAARDHHHRDGGISQIGFAAWPKWRLFGLHADPEGELELKLDFRDSPTRLHLNYACEPGGRIEIELLDHARGETGHTAVLTGDRLDEVVAWNGGAALPANARAARIRLFRATLWAFDLRKA